MQDGPGGCHPLGGGIVVFRAFCRIVRRHGGRCWPPPLFLLLHVLFHGLRLIFRRQVGNVYGHYVFPPAFKLSEAVFYAIDAGVQAAMKAALVRAVKNPLFVFPANMRWFPHGLFLLRLRATHVPAVVTVHRRPWAYFVHDNKHFLFLRRVRDLHILPRHRRAIQAELCQRAWYVELFRCFDEPAGNALAPGVLFQVCQRYA